MHPIGELIPRVGPHQTPYFPYFLHFFVFPFSHFLHFFFSLLLHSPHHFSLSSSFSSFHYSPSSHPLHFSYFPYLSHFIPILFIPLNLLLPSLLFFLPSTFPLFNSSSFSSFYFLNPSLNSPPTHQPFFIKK